MARLGIDFGTTNTVAVVYDRGMFTIVEHQVATAAGAVVQDTFPSTILIDRKRGQRWFGPEAERRFALVGGSSDCVYVPSLKRHLRDYAEGRSADLGDGEAGVDLGELLTGFLRELAVSIRTSLDLGKAEPLEAVITWPAHANGAQRHVTRRAFRDAGFDVRDTINEPTASAIELADRLVADRSGRADDAEATPSAVAVFDLGGGTFDASVVRVQGQSFRVLASGGIETLGGDDFDQALFDLFFTKLRHKPEKLAGLTRHALMRHVRFQKESISSGAIKSLFLDPHDFGLKGRPVSVSVNEYFDRVRPMLTPAIAKLLEVIESAMGELKAATPSGASSTSKPKRGSRSKATAPAGENAPPLTIYLVGGSSKLPIVAEMVAQAFPEHRVVRSDKPFRSVAMGAAICAQDRATYRDVFARHFGLIRLSDHGQREVFDTIFPAGTPLPRKGEPPLEKVVRYEPAHSIGRLRYLECTSLDARQMPAGDVRPWSEIFFPYDPGDPLAGSYNEADVVGRPPATLQPVCEVYRCDKDGVVTVELRRPAANDARCYEIYAE
jgi:molecular chaperone DnaK